MENDSGLFSHAALLHGDSFRCLISTKSKERAAHRAILSAGGSLLVRSAAQTVREEIADLRRFLGDFRASLDGFQIIFEMSLQDARDCTELWGDFAVSLVCRDIADLEEIEKLASKGRVIVEAFSPDVIEGIHSCRSVAGLIVTGEEAGGLTGPFSSFVLAQFMSRLQKKTSAAKVWFLRGGLGPDSGLAAAVAGSSGIVIDESAWLLREAGTSGTLRRIAEAAEGDEATVLGAAFGAPVRLLLHPSFPLSRSLERRAVEIEAQDVGAEIKRKKWLSAIAQAADEGQCLPCGQGIALARSTQDRFDRLGPLIAHVRSSRERLSSAATTLAAVLAEGSALAAQMGTRHPIVQGPMTRVSDQPAFARSVARAGGLPVVALAALSSEECDRLLAQTKEAVDHKPWGAGLLGFLPAAQLAPQLESVLRHRPPFVILAGGRVDQALKLEAEGVRAYLHAPTPSIARLMVDGGARRLILEGRECGGHVGPIHSLTLWEAVSNALRDHPAASELDILLAGGIHDGRSAAMAVAQVAALVAAGSRVGVLMGTAYLATQEAVAGGAITAGYQNAVLASKTTSLIESARGHSNRCLPGPFVDAFQDARRDLLRASADPDDMREKLDGLLVGRLRIASKGVRRSAGRLVAVDRATQSAEGMFMVGEVALNLDRLLSIKDLHLDVEAGSQILLAYGTKTLGEGQAKDSASSVVCHVAIIGVAVHVPGATDPQGFWRNILDKRSAITEVPEDRWDIKLYSSDSNQPDAITSKWGGFVGPIHFDPVAFGIPPKSVRHIAPAQLITLELARKALLDAGYLDRQFDRERTAVIVAAEDAGGFTGNALTARALGPLLAGPQAQAEIRARTPGWTEETFPGVLTSVVAGRIANRFDLGGANYTIDSACASSLTALSLACAELASGRASMVVMAGADATQTPYHYTAFSAVTALSARGRLSAFDQSADGTLLSEGFAAFILKRVEDAERDGDRIYAVIKSVACSSDGRGLGMTAPRPLGQKRAVRRAHAALGGNLGDIDLYEAHGTGTPVGDRAEIETVSQLLEASKSSANSCALGSVKALVGHTKTAAGAVGLAKVALALYHETIPPQPNVERPVAPLGKPESALYICDGPQPWVGSRRRRRRAGISAFGFGGTNAHAVLEEYRLGGSSVPGALRWPFTMLAMSASGKEALARLWTQVTAAAQDGPKAASLEEIAASACEHAQADLPLRSFAIVSDRSELARVAAQIAAHLSDETRSLPAGSFVADVSRVSASKLAFIFPGQGSQRLQMCRELAVYLPELRESLFEAAEIADQDGRARLDRIIYPPSAFDGATKAAQSARLTSPSVAQPAIGAISAGLCETLRSLGVHPDYVAGHSFGEYSALYAAGVIDRASLLQLAVSRGQAMTKAEDGAMCALLGDRAAISDVLNQFPSLTLANVNSDRQFVLSGPKADVERSLGVAEAAGVTGKLLPVGGAFHSSLMGPANEEFGARLGQVPLGVPRVPVISARSGKPFSSDAEEIRSQLQQQMIETVDWAAQMQVLLAEGVKVFVEVGPGAVLSQLVQTAARDTMDVSVLSLDDGTGLKGFLQAIGQLWLLGNHVMMNALVPVTVKRRPLSELAARAAEPPARTGWLVDGMKAWPANAEQRSSFDMPVLRTGMTCDEPSSVAPQGSLTSVRADSRFSHSDGEEMAATMQSEVVSAFAEYQATMRQFLITQEQVMRMMLGEGPLQPESSLPVPGVPVAAPTASMTPLGVPELPKPGALPLAAENLLQAPERSGSVVPDRVSLERQLAAIVSDRTGYPEEMVRFDQDIEAEFGIDSIKRLDIFERLAAALPDHCSQHFRATAESTARKRVLGDWIDAALDALRATEKPLPFDVGASERQVDGPRSPHISLEAAPAQAVALAPTHVMLARLTPPLPMEDVLAGPYGVVAGPRSITSALIAGLKKRGAVPFVVPTEQTALQAKLAAVRSEHGAIRGLVDLSGTCGAAEEPQLREQHPVGRLLDLVKLCLDDLKAFSTQPGRVFSASCLGGAFGRGSGGGHPIRTLEASFAGAALGFLNTLALEHPELSVRAVDFCDSMSASEIADAIANELCFSSGRVEVGYTGRGRVVFDVAEIRLPAAGRPVITAGMVLVATGGIRGVTAETLTAICSKGAKVFVLARSGVPKEESAQTANALDTVSLRRALLTDNPEQLKPSEIERKVKSILRDREARLGLAKLAAAGLKVEVLIADTRDPASVTRALDEVMDREGGIDALVHGAGIIEDKLILDKTRESFDRVYLTKVASLGALLTHRSAQALKYVLFFSSIAGRLGNRGQADYGAANEVLNRAALWFSDRNPNAKVVSINWGPWDGSGMASPSVNAMFRQRGIVPIPVRAGALTALAALSQETGPKQIVELIVGEGHWNADLRSEDRNGRGLTRDEGEGEKVRASIPQHAGE